MALRVEVVSPAGEAWAGEATQVSVPLINGELGIRGTAPPGAGARRRGPLRGCHS